MTVESAGFWPIQRAQMGGAERPVLAALTRRPGVDLVAMCWTYGGPDATATYESVFRSLSNSSDATWQAAATQQAAEAATRQAAAQEQHQPQQQAPAQNASQTRQRDYSHGAALPPHP